MIQRDDIGAAETLAQHESVARIDHVDVGDGGIADIDGGDRLGER